MGISGLKGAGYPAGFHSRTNIRNAFRKSGTGGRSSAVPNGNYHGTLKMGYLHSEFSPVSGQELHMKYDGSSTDEDPVMYVEGKDMHGNTFAGRIHLNDVDAENATPAEMTALRVHLAQQGDKQVKLSSGIPLKALSSHQDVNTEMNFKQYYEDWASGLEGAGFKKNADLYINELERYLFYHRTKGASYF